MLWRVTLRRLPILVLAYAFALQVIVAGWSGAVHGSGAANALFDALCRSPLLSSSDIGPAPTDSSPDPSTPAHHDCAFACLNAHGGTFAAADEPALATRDALVAIARTMDGAAFLRDGLAFAAFSARAPPHLI